MPSSFRDPPPAALAPGGRAAPGEILPRDFHVAIPRGARAAGARGCAVVLGDLGSRIAVRRACAPVHARPRGAARSTTPGARRCRSPAPTGFRRSRDAGNVLRPRTAVKLSLRTPADARRRARRRATEGAARDAIRPTARASASTSVDAPVRAGMRRRWPPGSSGPWTPRRATHFGRPPMSMGDGRLDPVHGHARRAVSRRAVRRHGAARARARTRTGRTSSFTSPRARELTACVAEVLADHHRAVRG